MSDANLVRLAYLEESTFGEVPSAASMNVIRFTGESLKQDTTLRRSQEIRSDRNTLSAKRVAVSGSGGINIEWAPEAYNDLIRHAVQSDAAWTTPVVVGPITTLSVTGATSTIADSGSGLAGIPLYSIINVTGFTTAANNGLKKVMTVSAGSITVQSLNTMVDEIAGDSVTITAGASVKNGKTSTSLAIEKEHVDSTMTNPFTRHLGFFVNQMRVNVAPEAYVTGGFDFIGKYLALAATTFGSGDTAAETDEPFGPVDEVFGVFRGGGGAAGAIDYQINGFALTSNNNRAPRGEVGAVGPRKVRNGTFTCTGTLSAYYDDDTALGQYLAGTKDEVTLLLKDPVTGGALIYDLPNIRYGDGQNSAGGLSQDVEVPLQWEAFYDTDQGFTMQVTSFPST